MKPQLVGAPPLSDQAFRELTNGAKFAWPTAILFIACLSGIASVSYWALGGALTLWQGAVINGVIVYFLFSVVHDSSHGAISTNKRLNDGFGHVGMLLFGPIAPLDLARWIHMQHHRFTNDPVKDPDHFGHRMDLLTPLRWANFDYFYTSYFLRNAGPMRARFMNRLYLQIGFVVLVTAAAFVTGHGWQLVMLWLVPTRISSFLFVLMFVYLPHAPFKATAQKDEYQASNIRAGFEWLLTPLMAFQNYHLVHHLYPRAPFYRMIRIWNARRGFHLGHHPYYVGTFSLGRAIPPPAR